MKYILKTRLAYFGILFFIFGSFNGHSVDIFNKNMETHKPLIDGEQLIKIIDLCQANHNDSECKTMIKRLQKLQGIDHTVYTIIQPCFDDPFSQGCTESKKILKKINDQNKQKKKIEIERKNKEKEAKDLEKAAETKNITERTQNLDRQYTIKDIKNCRASIDTPQCTKAHKFATSLRKYLDEIQYDSLIQQIMGDLYKYGDLIDEGSLKYFDQRRGPLDDDQEIIVNLFFFNKKVRITKIFNLDNPSHTELLRLLLELDLATITENKIALNKYWINSYSLANNKVMYLLNDYPQERLIKSDTNPEGKSSALLSETSHRLLRRIEQDYKTKRINSDGIVADFGSGTGIQAIALLLLYPDIQKAIGLEIDDHSMDVSVLNAQLNNVYTKFVVLNNYDTNTLTKELNGEKLTFAISNPPFNVVPESLSKYFSVFGDGGERGEFVTGIFLEQVNQHLADTGAFLFYSDLPINSKKEFLIQNLIKEKLPNGFECAILVDATAGYSTDQYIIGFTDFIIKNNPKKSFAPEVATLFLSLNLKKHDVIDFKSAVVYVKKSKNKSEFTFDEWDFNAL